MWALQVALLLDGVAAVDFFDLDLRARAVTIVPPLPGILDGTIVTVVLRATNRADLFADFTLERIKDTSPPVCTLAEVQLPAVSNGLCLAVAATIGPLISHLLVCMGDGRALPTLVFVVSNTQQYLCVRRFFERQPLTMAAGTVLCGAV
jgi:hypothetical protein